MKLKSHIYRIAALLIIVLLLIMTQVVLIAVYFQATLFDFVVSDWPIFNDEIHYWHEILTFSAAGFKGGYYVLEEITPKATFSHFGPHGPMFPLIYGLPSRLWGWYPYSSVLYNLLVITLALGVFIYLTQPNGQQLLATGLFLLTFWPLVLFIPSGMQESLHQGIAILLAGLFYKLIQTKPGQVGWVEVTLFIFIILASLIRYSWALLFIPYYLLLVPNRSGLMTGLALSISMILIIVFFLAFRYLAAPYPYNPMSNFQKELTISTWGGLEFLIDHIKTNLTAFVTFTRNPLGVVHHLLRYQILGLIGFSLAQHLLSSKGWNILARPQTGVIYWFNGLNLGILLVLLLLFNRFANNSFQDYRALAPHFLLSVLLLILFVKWRPVWIIILTSLSISPWFVATYRQVREHNFTYDRSSIITFREQTKDILAYTETENPWCNTLDVVDLEIYQPPLIAVPAGMGFSAILNWEEVQLPLKSKYILIPANKLTEIVQIRGDTHLQSFRLLAETVRGNVYLNLSSRCP
jgi:hypothetical protein